MTTPVFVVGSRPCVCLCVSVWAGACDIKCDVLRPFPLWTLGNRSFFGGRRNARVWIRFLDSGTAPDGNTGATKIFMIFRKAEKAQKTQGVHYFWLIWPIVQFLFSVLSRVFEMNLSSESSNLSFCKHVPLWIPAEGFYNLILHIFSIIIIVKMWKKKVDLLFRVQVSQ